MDKTGTMTEGVFKVQEVVIKPEFDKEEILNLVNSLESQSTHPVATAIHNFVGKIDSTIVLKDVEEITGHGLKANHNGKEILVGNFKLMDKYSINYDIDPSKIVYTLIAIAYDKKYVGHITIADSIKEDARLAVNRLNSMGVKTTMLSGDKNTVVQFVAQKLRISNAFGDLLPENKVEKVKEIIAKNESVAFVGDGVNDAPVVALSNVGIAMGGLGSDATIETADVVIQDDKPSKIPMAINIGKQTKKIVWQNIIMAFVVKGIVLILGAGGLATMWEAVFADVGVALLAILNAVRIQKMNFDS
jgi:Cd2+/Zn2+-exporting ATPase